MVKECPVELELHTGATTIRQERSEKILKWGEGGVVLLKK